MGICITGFLRVSTVGILIAKIGLSLITNHGIILGQCYFLNISENPMK